MNYSIWRDPMTWALFACLFILIILGIVELARAQEHSHQGAVGQFYSRLMQPPARIISCCNNQDCDVVEYVRHWNGQLQFQRKIDGQWLTIPPERLESNHDDARDSPDGRSHMCSHGENVYCAVLGSAT